MAALLIIDPLHRAILLETLSQDLPIRVGIIEFLLFCEFVVGLFKKVEGTKASNQIVPILMLQKFSILFDRPALGAHLHPHS